MSWQLHGWLTYCYVCVHRMQNSINVPHRSTEWICKPFLKNIFWQKVLKCNHKIILELFSSEYLRNVLVYSSENSNPDPKRYQKCKMAANLVYFCLFVLLACISCVCSQQTPPLDKVFKRGHTNNWAVLVSIFYLCSVFFCWVFLCLVSCLWYWLCCM